LKGARLIRRMFRHLAIMSDGRTEQLVKVKL